MKINFLTKTGLVFTLGFCIHFNALATEATEATEPATSAEYIPPVAGTQPSQRPAGAPVVTTVEKDGNWYKTAETGLQPPFSHSFNFLVPQGNWYNPFNRPGMTGPYDIRGWHDGESQMLWQQWQ